jgi:hypothetical protein
MEASEPEPLGPPPLFSEPEYKTWINVIRKALQLYTASDIGYMQDMMEILPLDPETFYTNPSELLMKVTGKKHAATIQPDALGYLVTLIEKILRYYTVEDTIIEPSDSDCSNTLYTAIGVIQAVITTMSKDAVHLKKYYGIDHDIQALVNANPKLGSSMDGTGVRVGQLISCFLKYIAVNISRHTLHAPTTTNVRIISTIILSVPGVHYDCELIAALQA